MIVLDTNVVSALMRPLIETRVMRWADNLSKAILWTTSLTVLETRSGLLRLPEGRRKAEMTAAFDLLLVELAGRILPFDAVAAEAAAAATARRIASGINIDTLDTQIAGICISRRATLATRNVKDFADIDITLINPWEA